MTKTRENAHTINKLFKAFKQNFANYICKHLIDDKHYYFKYVLSILWKSGKWHSLKISVKAYHNNVEVLKNINIKRY